jgi:hypothetical protein
MTPRQLGDSFCNSVPNGFVPISQQQQIGSFQYRGFGPHLAARGSELINKGVSNRHLRQPKMPCRPQVAAWKVTRRQHLAGRKVICRRQRGRLDRKASATLLTLRTQGRLAADGALARMRPGSSWEMLLARGCASTTVVLGIAIARKRSGGQHTRHDNMRWWRSLPPRTQGASSDLIPALRSLDSSFNIRPPPTWLRSRVGVDQPAWMVAAHTWPAAIRRRPRRSLLAALAYVRGWGGPQTEPRRCCKLPPGSAWRATAAALQPPRDDESAQRTILIRTRRCGARVASPVHRRRLCRFALFAPHSTPRKCARASPAPRRIPVVAATSLQTEQEARPGSVWSRRCRWRRTMAAARQHGYVGWRALCCCCCKCFEPAEGGSTSGFVYRPQLAASSRIRKPVSTMQCRRRAARRVSPISAQIAASAGTARPKAGGARTVVCR